MSSTLLQRDVSRACFFHIANRLITLPDLSPKAIVNAEG